MGKLSTTDESNASVGCGWCPGKSSGVEKLYGVFVLLMARANAFCDVS